MRFVALRSAETFTTTDLLYWFPSPHNSVVSLILLFWACPGKLPGRDLISTVYGALNYVNGSQCTQLERAAYSAMPSSAKSSPGDWDIDIYGLKAIGQGGAAIVFSVDEFTAIKVPIPSPFALKAIEQEREIYRLLNEKPKSQYVIACISTIHTAGVLLEKCIGSVRGRLRLMKQGGHGYSKIGSDEALGQAGRWAYQAAQGLAFIHSHGVIQADGS